jgi:thiol-disulfide isomerase/thioredoxin
MEPAQPLLAGFKLNPMIKNTNVSKWLSRGVNFLLVGLLAKFAWESYQRQQSHNSLIGYQIRDAQVVDRHGQATNLLQGSLSPRVLIFWASWCGPCEMQLGRLRDALADGSVPSAEIFAAISIDDDFAAALDAAEKRHYAFPIYWDQDHALSSRLKITAVPTFIYLDSSQTIVDIETGLNPMLIANIKNHIKETIPP